MPLRFVKPSDEPAHRRQQPHLIEQRGVQQIRQRPHFSGTFARPGIDSPRAPGATGRRAPSCVARACRDSWSARRGAARSSRAGRARDDAVPHPATVSSRLDSCRYSSSRCLASSAMRWACAAAAARRSFASRSWLMRSSSSVLACTASAWASSDRFCASNRRDDQPLVRFSHLAHETLDVRHESSDAASRAPKRRLLPEAHRPLASVLHARATAARARRAHVTRSLLRTPRL